MVVLVSYTIVRMNFEAFASTLFMLSGLEGRELAFDTCTCYFVTPSQKLKKNGDLISSRCHLKINICCIYQVVGMVHWWAATILGIFV